MLEISGNEILGQSGLGTFQKHIVVWIGAHLDRLLRSNPQGCFADSLKRIGNDVRVAPKPGTTYDLFVLGIDAGGDAKPKGDIQRQEQQLGGWTKGLKQRRNKDVRIKNDANH